MKFELSFWNYLYIDDYYAGMETAVKEWKELGITLGFTFRYAAGKSSRQKMLRLLDLCAENGIRAIVSDDRVFWTQFREKGEKAYAAAVSAAAEDFAAHPACYGFYIGDEPDTSMFDDFGKAYKIFKSICDKVGFINYSWNESLDRKFGGRENYRKFLSDFYTEVSTETVSNDRYSAFNFCDYEPGFLEKGKEYYFADVRMFSGLAKERGVPYFLSQLSCGHFNFRTPDADAIRWQLSTAAACGANAVQWFHIYQHAFHEDYYVYPVDKFGNKSEIYGCIVRETATFREKVLKPLDGFEHETTYFITKAYGGYPLLSRESGCEWFVYADHGMNGILSVFTDGKTKKYMVVNNDQHTPELFWMENKRDSSKNHHLWLAPGGTHIFG